LRTAEFLKKIKVFVEKFQSICGGKKLFVNLGLGWLGLKIPLCVPRLNPTATAPPLPIT
jgi:hypothetical protein